MAEENFNNKFVHLTNNAIQKTSKQYSSYEDGNQLSFDDFQEYLTKMHPNKNISVRDEIVTLMKSIIKKTLFSSRKKINAERRNLCFEIFGYDFIIDSDFNLWLIEINTNPCLELSSKLLAKLIPRMLDDAFKLTIDLAFPLHKINDSTIQTKKFSVDKYNDDENLWEKICDLNQNIYSIAFDSAKINSEFFININEQQILKIKKNNLNSKRKMLYAKRTYYNKQNKPITKVEKNELESDISKIKNKELYNSN